MFVAGSIDNSTGVMNLYINNSLVNTTVTSIRAAGVLNAGQNPGVGIGNVESSVCNEYFNGLIDEVRISNTALSQGQLLNAPEPATTGALVPTAMIALVRRKERKTGTRRLCLNPLSRRVAARCCA